MDVQGRPPGADGPDGSDEAPAALPGRSGRLSGERVGRALGEWQAGELRLARSFGECRGLGHEQLEDLYQETALVLLERTFHSEQHLRNALRWGIKHRALHLHRDERRRGEILSQRAPEMQLAAEGREADRAPELAAVSEDDRLIVTEFLTELDDLERRVFWLMAEGMRYRAIAPVLQVSVNEARKAARACEAKRARFQLLYDTGRLCGFRSQTIAAMRAGEPVGDDLAQRAFAHLEGCAHCRTEHRTNARRLRRTFQGQAAALLPIPAIAGHLGWFAKLGLRVRAVQERAVPFGSPPGTGGSARTSRWRSSRAAAPRRSSRPAQRRSPSSPVARSERRMPCSLTPTGSTRHRRPSRAPRHTSASSAARCSPTLRRVSRRSGPAAAPHDRRTSEADMATGARHEPGGFSFLGVPSASTSHSDAPVRASTASTPSAPPTSNGEGKGAAVGGEEQRGGGPFSP